MIPYTDKEEWKLIPGFPHYEVSNLGNVRHSRHRRILKGGLPYNGYRQVGIERSRRGHTKCVHQLVALAFLGPKPVGYEVSHKDNNKANNQLSNLEYVPWRENRKSFYREVCPFCKRIFKQSVAYHRHQKLKGECKMKKVETPKLKCVKCGWRWTPRKPEVWQCPRCKSPKFYSTQRSAPKPIQKKPRKKMFGII